MSLQVFFPHLHGFRLLAFQREPQRLVLICERVTRAAVCPVCGGLAWRIHSPVISAPSGICPCTSTRWSCTSTSVSSAVISRPVRDVSSPNAQAKGLMSGCARCEPPPSPSSWPLHAVSNRTKPPFLPG